MRGSTSHAEGFVAAPGGHAVQKAVALVESGEVVPVIDRTFSFAEGGEAISYHKTGRGRYGRCRRSCRKEAGRCD